MSSIYLIGSLRNPKVPEVAPRLRAAGHDVFDDWFAAGPEADDYWQKYEINRNHNYKQALAGYAAGHVYEFDKYHLARRDATVLLLPADRWDVMYKFASAVYFDVESLIQGLEKGVLEIRTSSTEAKHKQRRITWKQLAEPLKMPVESMIKCNLTN